MSLKSRLPMFPLLKQMIDIQSVSGAEKGMADFLQDYLATRGWTVERQNVVGDRDNIYAYRGKERATKVLMSTHIDTVPPYIPAGEDEEKITGRGACDAKGNLVAQLFAAEELLEEGKIKEGDVGLLYVVGEEVDAVGMKKANELGLKPAFLINGEPTESKVATGHKGMVAFKIETLGSAAHSGYPKLGVSALDPLIEILHDMLHQEWPTDSTLGPTTLNIGHVNGGVAVNVIPASGLATGSVRVVSNYNEICQRLEQIVGNRATITYSSLSNPVRCEAVPGFECEPVAFGTDIPHFHFDGKVILFGPGSIHVAHTSREFINKAELVAGVDALKTLVAYALSNA